MSLFVLCDGELIGMEAVAAQEDIDEPVGKEGEGAGHEGALLIGDGHLGQVLKLLAQQLVEPLGVACLMAVEELVLGFGPRILLQDVIHAGEGIEVVVCKVSDYWFHGYLWSFIYIAKVQNIPQDGKKIPKKVIYSPEWERLRGVKAESS